MGYDQQYGQMPEGMGSENPSTIGGNYFGGFANHNNFSMADSEQNWDRVSEESEEEDFGDCDERSEYEFENKARYKGQWKNNMRHGMGT